MKRGSQLTLKINSLEFPSTGISECEGKKIYVKGAFPGQTVKATVKKKRDEYAEAKLVEVIERAEYEIPAPCPHFGGCLSLIHIWTGLAEGDLGRIKNQQAFIAKVIEKCTSPEIITQIPSILKAVKENIVTNMSGSDMIYYGLKMVKNEGISMNTLQDVYKRQIRN